MNSTLRESSEYGIWRTMLTRCRNPKFPTYKRYGARGIRVCARWHRFENFYADMGRRPSKDHSIDRIDNDGNYEPGNVRWATREEQNANRREPVGEARVNHKLTDEKVRVVRTMIRQGWTIKQIAAKFGVGKGTISDVKYGQTWRHVA